MNAVSLQNSMRATIERYGEFSKLPPVEVLATLGNEDLTIRVINVVRILRKICQAESSGGTYVKVQL